MNQFKKIAVVVESIDIDDSSGSKANIALIQNLQLIGYEMAVYHFTRKEIQLNKIKCYSINEKKRFLYILSRLQRVIQRVFKLNFAKKLESIFGFSFTFFNDVNSIKSYIGNKIDESDLILTLSKGASFRSHYALLKLPKLHHKWLAYIHDPYPFHYYPKPYDWFEPGFKKKEAFFKEVSEKAYYSAFPSLLLKEWMGNFFPNLLKTGLVIPHQNIEIKYNEYELPSFFDSKKFNLLHSGSLLKQRSPEGLIQGFNLFLKKNPEAKRHAKLMLIGNASYYKTKLEKYESEIPQLFIYLKNMSFSKVQTLQNSVTANIILESKSTISPFLPGKFPHCISANKPIILLGPNNSETKRLLGSSYPYWAEVEAIEKIAAIIKDLYDIWLLDPTSFKLNRPDMKSYISADYLYEVISNLNSAS